MKQSIKLVKVITTLRTHWPDYENYEVTDYILICDNEPVEYLISMMYGSHNDIIKWNVIEEVEPAISRASIAFIVKGFINNQLDEYE